MRNRLSINKWFCGIDVYSKTRMVWALVSVLKRLKKIFAAVVSAAVVFAAVPAVNCAEADETVDYQAYSEEMLFLVNEARIDAGLKPLATAPALYDVSKLRAEEISVSFSHVRPDGTNFHTAAEEAGIPLGAAYENIAAGSSSAEATFIQWKNSAPHWNNIMSDAHTHMSVGVYYSEGSRYGWYWELLFISTDEVFDGQQTLVRDPIIPVSYGDIDGDGKVSSFDVVLMRMYLDDKISFNELQTEYADCIKDGAVTSSDLKALQRYVLKIYDSLPYEF